MKTMKKMVAKKAPKKYQTGGPITTTSTNTTKKPKSVSEKIGDITLRDVKNAGEDALQIATLGGYGKVKKALGSEYKYKKIGEKKNGGKITAKNGTTIKKAQKGTTIKKSNPMMKKTTTTKKAAPKKAMMQQQPMQQPMQQAQPMMKKGGKITKKTSMKKCMSGCK